jgi:hypothetical protein
MVFLVAGWTFIVGYGRRILFGYSPKRVLYNKYNV